MKDIPTLQIERLQADIRRYNIAELIRLQNVRRQIGYTIILLPVCVVVTSRVPVFVVCMLFMLLYDLALILDFYWFKHQGKRYVRGKEYAIEVWREQKQREAELAAIDWKSGSPEVNVLRAFCAFL